MAAKVYAISPVGPTLHAHLSAHGTPLVSIATFDERRAAQSIHADQPDLLIDVTAFGSYAKPGLLSHRPARVQISLPGFTHPVGIGELDYRLSDNVAEIESGPEAVSPLPIVLDGCALPLLQIGRASWRERVCNGV